MKSFGKGLFWSGFILLMGVVVSYLIMMVADTLALTSRVTALTLCGVIFAGGLLMLIGRSSERHADARGPRPLRPVETTDAAGGGPQV